MGRASSRASPSISTASRKNWAELPQWFHSGSSGYFDTYLLQATGFSPGHRGISAIIWRKQNQRICWKKYAEFALGPHAGPSGNCVIIQCKMLTTHWKMTDFKHLQDAREPQVRSHSQTIISTSFGVLDPFSPILEGWAA